ncbi:oxygenase MpaB family protein [Actinomadura kijaniata]|uniref:oxygenase MpaB family protein n=1 Tax=Actinomadura kijaniata TaxID=46161 RepID=UPI0009FEB5FD|nr:oxygenase MpaB family protein [Actinomadura kijaniata]
MTLTEPTPLTPSPGHVPEETGRTAGQREPEPFGPGSILWDDLGMYLSAVAGNSAFILQAMHPAIGTVVDQLSSFRADPVGRAMRSFASVQTWVYGGEEAIAEGRRLRRMHKPLSAEDENGTRHHALSAEPWAWVHLTGYYAADTVARRFSPEPLTPERERRLFEEFMNLGRILQVPERMLPATVADFWTYFDRMVADTLVPHRVALEVLDRMDKVPPTVPARLRPLLAPLSLTGGRLARFVTVGTLPPGARDKLGLSWTARDERRLRVLATVLGRTAPLLPERVRYMPIAYRARQAARAHRRWQEALAGRPL